MHGTKTLLFPTCFSHSVRNSYLFYIEYSPLGSLTPSLYSVLSDLKCLQSVGFVSQAISVRQMSPIGIHVRRRMKKGLIATEKKTKSRYNFRQILTTAQHVFGRDRVFGVSFCRERANLDLADSATDKDFP